MAPNKVVKADDSLIDQLCSIASVSRIVATNLLEACDNNLEMALNMQMEGVVTDSNGASSSSHNDDEVRAPIPQKQEILVEGPDQLSYSFRGRSRISRSVFDKFRDFEAEAKRQEEELMEEGSTSVASSSHMFNKQKRKMKTLEDLFRPPLDLMFRGTFQSARETGIGSRKWLMVNVQNSTEFPCQVLNRDVWSNSAVKTIVQEHFIFWQIYHDSEEGQRYMTFYPVNDWPYIAIIDPRTGEKLVEWQKMDALSFCDLITEFLSSQPSMEDSFGSSRTHPKKKLKLNENIIEADEDAQLEAAIKASLETASTAKEELNLFSKSDNEVSDSDESLESLGTDSESGEVSSKGTSSCPVFNNDASCSSHSLEAKKKAAPLAFLAKAKKEVVVNGNNENESRSEENNLKSADDESEECETENYSDDVDRWKRYLGKETDPSAKLVLRLPDGTRESIDMPKSSKLMALVLFVATKGYTNESYELVTNFPRKQLSYMDFESSLEAVGLFPQETVFVQKR